MKHAGKMLIIVAILTTLSGCDFESNNNLKDVPDLGLFIYLEANRHQNNEEAQVAAAVFNDAQPINLVGGDVFQAHTDTNNTLLKKSGFYTGSYSGSLPVNDLDTELAVTIVHEPIQAREDRWYPIDLVNVDPGPGELVGHTATATFPPPVAILTPQPAIPFSSIDDTIELNWIASTGGDTMFVRAATTCDNGLVISTYGTEVAVGADDGIESIAMTSFIFDTADEFPVLDFISDIALYTLQQILNDLSAGKIDPDFFALKIPANPIESECEIRMFLFRQRLGTFDTAFDSGSVIGSTSSEMTIYYSPN